MAKVFLHDGTPFYTGPYVSCSVISTYPAWSDAIYHCDYLNTNNVWFTHLKLTSASRRVAIPAERSTHRREVHNDPDTTSPGR